MQKHLAEQHLSDERMTGLLLGEQVEGAEEHLARCAACQVEYQRLSGAVTSLRESARAAAERPEAFWQYQRSAIAARWQEILSGSTRRLAWAVAVAVIVLAAVLLTGEPPSGPSIAQWDSDHALLVDVERSVNREVPEALEPAALLAQEIRLASEARATQKVNP